MEHDQLTIGDIIQKEEIANRELIPQDPLQLIGKNIAGFISKLLDHLGVGEEPVIHGRVDEGAFIRGRVYVAEGAVVEPTAFIQGPCYIGEGTEVRHGAYIRGNVYVGKKCVVGHTTEVKNSAFLDGAKAGHFAYIGDSLLGPKVNLGAGTKLANLKLDEKEVKYRSPHSKKILGSGLKKMGSILAVGSQTGCNAVLSPGTILMPGSVVWPCCHFRGTLLEGQIHH